uniref:Uncharacterized protein n=1 Tax=Myotis myotis TaxID=51298 RepID=A0A7J7XI01_MYOMY|nr:hypothetical protein mMyoMyo1_011798 [Myotis myotis]
MAVKLFITNVVHVHGFWMFRNATQRKMKRRDLGSYRQLFRGGSPGTPSPLDTGPLCAAVGMPRSAGRLTPTPWSRLARRTAGGPSQQPTWPPAASLPPAETTCPSGAGALAEGQRRQRLRGLTGIFFFKDYFISSLIFIITFFLLTLDFVCASFYTSGVKVD